MIHIYINLYYVTLHTNITGYYYM